MEGKQPKSRGGSSEKREARKRVKESLLALFARVRESGWTDVEIMLTLVRGANDDSNKGQ